MGRNSYEADEEYKILSVVQKENYLHGLNSAFGRGLASVLVLAILGTASLAIGNKESIKLFQEAWPYIYAAAVGALVPTFAAKIGERRAESTIEDIQESILVMRLREDEKYQAMLIELKDLKKNNKNGINNSKIEVLLEKISTYQFNKKDKLEEELAEKSFGVSGG